METTTATRTNAAPRRRRPGLSRRASMSSLPVTKSQVDAAGGDLGLMTTKESLKAQYEAQRKAVKQAHKQAKKEFEKQMQEAASMATQTFASDTMYDDDGHTSNAYDNGNGSSQKEASSSKITLETFSMPKVSRRQRRASLGITLRILTPPQSPMVNLEDIDTSVNVNNVVAATPALPLTSSNDEGTTTTSRNNGAGIIDRRAMMARSLSCDMAESLAGWKTVDFPAGQPMGLQLEPTVNSGKGARVTGFLDEDGDVANDGDVHLARDEYKVDIDDIIVKVNGKLVKTFDETVKVLKAQAHEERTVTFRPAFIYEISGGASLLDKARKSKKASSSSNSKKDSLGLGGSHHRGGKKKRTKKVDQDADEEHAADAVAAAESGNADVVEPEKEDQDNQATAGKPKLQIEAFVPGVTTGAAIVPKQVSEDNGDDDDIEQDAEKKKKKKSSSKSKSKLSSSSSRRNLYKKKSSRKLRVEKEQEENENAKGDDNDADEIADADSNSEKEKWPVVQM